ncbi:RidA family protein [Photorhabdus namnaonensis]|uniref:Enamine/imine deaminase n=1 Tax=Photorhabdus namnaonensis TaxID=1851568 RepID=A0A1B8YCF9_9GAMM|nr:RidA family protein [Photorhabdus namnaonensis]OCA52823.1 Enamine/imine deaminase [Photorhabdus namnaonensis]
MTIERIDPQDRWSEAVVYNKTIYYTAVPENLDGDITEQTANTLAAIDIMLQRLGSDKSKIIDATIFLADGKEFAGMNAAWDAWVVAGSAPVRCTVEAKLMNPKYKVEIKVIAGI